MITLEDVRQICLGLEGVEEGYPFDNETLVFKVNHKIFALVNTLRFEFINLKCEPERAIALRLEYEEVKPGWHMNKKHWNSVYLYGRVTKVLLKNWIEHSYSLVKKKR